MPAEHIDLLEAMDLITWSVPEGTVYSLTALGQAVYEALRKGGYAPDDMLGYATYDAVLDEPILEMLTLLLDQGSTALTSEQLLDLQTLGYVESDGTLSTAGQAAMRAHIHCSSVRARDRSAPSRLPSLRSRFWQRYSN